MSLGGLQTTANVNIKVGVQRQASFNQFEQRLNAIKASLNEVSRVAGGTTRGGRTPTPAQQTALETARIRQQAAQLRLQTAQNVATASGARVQTAQNTAVASGLRLQGQQIRQQRVATAAIEKTARARAKDITTRAREAASWNRQFAQADRAWQKTRAKDITTRAREAASWNRQFAQADRAWQKNMLAARATNSSRALQRNVGGMSASALGVDQKRWDLATAATRRYVAGLKPGVDATSKFVAAQRRMNAALVQERTHMARMKSEWGYRLDQTEKRLDAFFRAAFRLQMVGQSLMMVGRRIANVIGGIMTTFGDFQYTMNRAGAALSIFGESNVEGKVGLKELQEGILSLSREVKLIPTKDVAEALYFWASATGSVVDTSEDLQREVDALTPIMQAAQMTNTDYETSIKGVYAVLTQFYSGDVSHAADVTTRLYQATQATALEFVDLINSFKMIGPIAKANNVSFEEMVSLFGRLGDLGIRGTMAGRALRQLLIKISKPTPEATTVLNEAFGSAAANKAATFQNGKFVGIIQYIRNLAEATKNLNSEERNRIVARITTANELPAVIALLTSEIRVITGLDTATNKYTVTQEEANETFRKSWEQLSGTWKAVVGSVQRAWEGLQIQIGSSLTTVLNPLMATLADIVEQLRIWAKANPQVVQAIGQLAAFAVVISTTAGAALTLIGSIIGIGTAFALLIGAIGPKMGQLVGFIGIIGAVFAALVKNIDYVSGQFDKAYKNIQQAMSRSSDAVGNFGDVFKEVFDTVGDIFGIVIRMAADVVYHFSNFVNILSELGAIGPALETIKFLMVAIFAQKSITAILGVFRGISLLNIQMRILGPAAVGASAGMRGLATSIKAAFLAMGPIGWAITAISLGFAAMETNFLGFGDFIDGITNNFRDLKKEMKETTEAFGEVLGPKVATTAAAIASEVANVDGAVAEALARGKTAYAGGRQSVYEAFIFGQSVLGVDETVLRKNAEKKAEEYAGIVAGSIEQTRANLAVTLAKAGQDPILSEAFVKAFLAFRIDTSKIHLADDVLGEEANKLNEFTSSGVVSFILEQIAIGGVGDANKEFVKRELIRLWGADGVDDIISGGFDAAWTAYIGSGAVANQVGRSIQLQQNKFFMPMVDKIEDMLEGASFDASGLTAATQAKLSEMLRTSVGGKESLAELMGDQNISPELKVAIQAFFDLLGEDALDALNNTVVEKTAHGILEDWVSRFVAALTGVKDVRSAISSAFKRGGDKARLEDAFSKLFAIDPKKMSFWKAFLHTGGNSELKLKMDEMVIGLTGLIDTYLEQNPGATKGGIVSMLSGYLPSVSDLRNAGMSKKDAEKVVTTLRKRLEPILSFIADPLAPPKRGYGGKKTGDPQTDLSNSRGAFNQAAQYAKKDTSAAYKTGETIVNDVAAGVNATSATAVQSVTDVVTAAGDELNTLSPIATTAGQDVVTTFATAVTNNASKATEAAATLAASFMQAFSDGLTSGGKDGKGASMGSIILKFGRLDNAMVNAFDIDKAYNIGTSWANKFNQGMIDNLMDGLTFIGAIFIGNSPPKHGPLKDIDKGGFNVGSSWGESLVRGASDATRKGLADMRRASFDDASVTYKGESERKLKIEVDIKSTDGTANGKTQGQVREAVIKALSLDAVMHLAQVS